MAKLATFSVVKASTHSSAHNSREDTPEYLIGIDEGEENVYDLHHSDSQFLELAKVKYKETTGQKMQQKQIDALIKETVLSLENHHAESDVQKVFDQLNEKYGGHYITELSIHRDEGHFEDKNGITYYPTKDILRKKDGWYIVPLDQSINHKSSYKPKEHEFSEKVDINEFKPIHNIHAHVKFSMFDLRTGRTGRMKHNELNDRIKTAARVLKLEYNPENGSKGRVAVEQIKTQHKAVRNEKIKALSEVVVKEIAVLATQKDLKAEIAQLREQLKDRGAERAEYAKIEQLNKDLKEQIKAKDLTADELKISINNSVRELNFIPVTDSKLYSTGSLIKLLIKRNKQSAETKQQLETERDALILKIKEQEHIKKEPEERLQEELKKQAEELQEIDKMFGQIVGLIEAGASAEELQKVVEIHEPYKPKRPAYINAKTRAIEAYKSKLIKKQPEPEEELLVSRALADEQHTDSTRTFRNI